MNRHLFIPAKRRNKGIGPEIPVTYTFHHKRGSKILKLMIKRLRIQIIRTKLLRGSWGSLDDKMSERGDSFISPYRMIDDEIHAGDLCRPKCLFNV